MKAVRLWAANAAMYVGAIKERSNEFVRPLNRNVCNRPCCRIEFGKMSLALLALLSQKCQTFGSVHCVAWEGWRSSANSQLLMNKITVLCNFPANSLLAKSLTTPLGYLSNLESLFSQLAFHVTSKLRTGLLRSSVIVAASMVGANLGP